LKRASYLAPFEWKIAYNLGLVHLTFKQYASAFHFLKAALTLRPRNGQIFMLLAVALTHLNDLETAGKAYEQAIEFEPNNPTFHLNYSLALYKAGNRRAASQQFKLFEQNFKAQQGEVDPEILSLSSRLGPALQVGEDLVWRETSGNQQTKKPTKDKNSDGTRDNRKPPATAVQQ
jgi:Bardet-Biedl syndrome 4 protein